MKSNGKRNLRLIAVSAGVTTPLWFLSGANAAPSYNVIDLGVLGNPNDSSLALGINNAGTIVGQSFNSVSFNGQAFVYSGGTMTNMTPLVGGTTSAAEAINTAGQIAGWADNSAFIASGMTVTPVAAPAGYNGIFFTSLNNSGSAAGEAYVGSGAGPSAWEAFEYVGGTLVDMGNLGNQRSQALGINDAGVVVGNSYTPAGDDTAFVYTTGGGIQSLGTLAGPTGDSSANAINEAGLITGGATTAGGGYDAFTYDGTMHDLGNLGGESEGMGINNLDQIVGDSYTLPGFNGNHEAILYSGGALYDLNSLIPAGSGWQLNQAYAINDAGDIVGYGMNPQGNTYEAFELVPTAVPEPATMSMILMGGALLLKRRRRKGDEKS